MTEERIAIIDGCLYNEETGEACISAKFGQKIVRCKDCKHGRLFDTNCVDCEYRELATDADWFCADAERRTDGSD